MAKVGIKRKSVGLLTAGKHGLHRRKPYGRLIITRRAIRPGSQYRVSDRKDGGFVVVPV